MTVPRTVSKKVAIMAGGGVLFLAVAAWGVSAHFKTPAQAPPPDPEKLREALQKPDLTEEQRHEIEHSMRQVFEAQLDSRVQDYFKAPENEKLAILDKQIDEFEKRRKEWEDRRKQEEERRAQAGERQDGPTSQPAHDWRQQQSTPQERKARSESRSADQMAQRMAYFAAVRARAEARGIQMPFGPGGRGGPGGGHGPGGGGT
jgi:hypothetical protein